MISWINLDSLSVLEDAVKASYKNEIIIFKHSTSCSISHMAKLRLESDWDMKDITPYYLDLKTYRSLSQEVSEKFKVHHESPQILLIKNGECVYDASHFDITVDELKETLAWHAR